MTDKNFTSPLLKLIFAGTTPVRDDTKCTLRRVHFCRQDGEPRSFSSLVVGFQLGDIEDLAKEMSIAVSDDFEELIAELERDEVSLHHHYQGELDGSALELHSIYSQDDLQDVTTSYVLDRETGGSQTLFSLKKGSPSAGDLLRVASDVYYSLNADRPKCAQVAALLRPPPANT